MSCCAHSCSCGSSCYCISCCKKMLLVLMVLLLFLYIVTKMLLLASMIKECRHRQLLCRQLDTTRGGEGEAKGKAF